MSKKRIKPDEIEPNLDDIRRSHREDYMAGRKQHEDGQPGIVPVSIRGSARIAIFLGWYDSFFYRKYSAPWPGPEGI